MIVDLHSDDRAHVKRARHCRVWLNGEEVSAQIFYADDEAGIVCGYISDKDAAELDLEDPSFSALYTPPIDEQGWVERRGNVRIEWPTTCQIAPDKSTPTDCPGCGGIADDCYPAVCPRTRTCESETNR